MGKEQKKLLLVAVSVGVFLLVTITVAIIVLTPKTQTQGIAFSSTPSAQQPVQQIVQAGATQPVESTGENPPMPVINNSQETNIYISSDNPDANITVDQNDGERLVIQIPRPTTAAVPDTSSTTSSSTNVLPAAPVSTSASASAAASDTRPAAATQPASVSRPPAAAATVTPSRTINDYWVQTGAFSAMVRAEDARELLASKGFVSIIENREIDGNLWYRVRLGPYTSENEANYWLALVQAIDGFGDSQVRQTTRTQ